MSKQTIQMQRRGQRLECVSPAYSLTFAGEREAGQ
jgi:hypothetical protein